MEESFLIVPEADSAKYRLFSESTTIPVGVVRFERIVLTLPLGSKTLSFPYPGLAYSVK